MKKNTILNSSTICLFLLAVCFSCKKTKLTSSCLSSGLQSGLIAFYPFENASLNDESGNNHHLTNSTTAFSSVDRKGNANCAYEFKGKASNSDFVSTTDTKFLDKKTTFSISLWYQPKDTTRNGGKFENLISRGETFRCPDRSGEWSIGLYDCRRAVFGHNNSVWAKMTSNPSSCGAEIKKVTNVWHHVVAIVNNGTYKIYFDGNLDETEIGSAQCSDSYLAQDIGDLIIGRKFTGKIDDILIYNREINAKEVTELFNLEPCCQ